jgi:copper(I)-binding protein
MTILRWTAAFTVLALFYSAPAIAQQDPARHQAPAAKTVEVIAAWARASATPRGAGAAYVSIRNAGTEGDRLIGAKTTVAKRAMLHMSYIDDNEVARMQRVAGVDVPAGGMVAMHPGGDHVMLMGLNAPLEEGATFPLTLVFEKAGEIPVTVDVLSVTAEGPKQRAGGSGRQMEHGSMPRGHGGMKASIPTVPEDLDLRTRKLSAHGLYDVAFTSALDPLVINQMHSWIVEVKTPDGEPVTGAKVAVEGGMPTHLHSLPTAPRVTKELGEGRYLVEGMEFNMGGWWELKLNVAAAGKTDEVTFNVLLRGQ